MPAAPKSHNTFTLEQAVGAAPSLAALQERIRESRWCLDQVQHLIPAGMRAHVRPGPLQDQEWCLLVASAAASTKLRQLVPALQLALTQRGAQVTAIRIKVQTSGR
ncbi:DciA family protein [Hydrogenophaga sp. 2FB]|uniref:DciA family protein n=1 Tax=Hydrogenophaga sp. 2FB TaxID=2502187 RepID=UPI0010F5C966|nr:DciA family protein [Hydrogenophaga sp. 2FB]